MESSEEGSEVPFPPNPNNATNGEAEDEDNDNNNNSSIDQQDAEDEEEEDEEEEDEDEDDDVVSHRKPQSPLSKLREQRLRLETLSRRLSSELVPIRVHDVVINGNTKTKDWVIEAELKGIENATTVQELLRESEIALARLQSLGIFDSSKVRLEPGPPELPDTANVVVDIVEAVNNVSGEFGVYTKPSVQSCSLFLFISYVVWY